MLDPPPFWAPRTSSFGENKFVLPVEGRQHHEHLESCAHWQSFRADPWRMLACPAILTEMFAVF